MPFAFFSQDGDTGLFQGFDIPVDGSGADTKFVGKTCRRQPSFGLQLR